MKNISPVFGGINLEDIESPKCFEVERALQEIGIPVFHDDQHGTAIVCLAGLINALKVVKKDFSEIFSTFKLGIFVFVFKFYHLGIVILSPTITFINKVGNSLV
mgnify:CR=1 FL=1